MVQYVTHRLAACKGMPCASSITRAVS
jgi:hypothetical protein